MWAGAARATIAAIDRFQPLRWELTLGARLCKLPGKSARVAWVRVECWGRRGCYWPMSVVSSPRRSRTASIRDNAMAPVATGIVRGTQIARRLMAGWSQRAAGCLDRLGVTPNMITCLSLLLAVGSGCLVAAGAFYAATILLIVSGLCDLVDGYLARAAGRCSRFGALLDSTLDRVSDGAPLLGLSIFYSRVGPVVVIPAATLLAAYTVSYIRARAESLGLQLPRLWMRREERLVMVCVALMLGGRELPGLPVPASMTLIGVALVGVGSIVASISALMAAHAAQDIRSPQDIRSRQAIRSPLPPIPAVTDDEGRNSCGDDSAGNGRKNAQYVPRHAAERTVSTGAAECRDRGASGSRQLAANETVTFSRYEAKVASPEVMTDGTAR